MRSPLLRSDEMTRRDFAATTARALLGVGLLPGIFAARSQAATATAKRVIYLYMTGGMSHLDTLDPKEGVATAGPVKSNRSCARSPRRRARFAQALGLPLDKKVMSPSDRPFTMADKGRPITALFA